MRLLLRHRAFFVVLACLAPLYLWLNAVDTLGNVGGDGLIYYLTAWQYAPWTPTDPLAVVVARDSQFPPMYSLLLMAFGAIYSFLAAHIVTAVFLLCAFAAFYAWLLESGIDRVRAAVATLLFGILPGTFLQSFYLHPEGLYVAQAFVAFTLLERGERTARVGYFWGAAGAIAVAFITRTVGLTLLPALGIVLLRTRPRGWPAMLALAVLPAIVWNLVHHPELAYSQALARKYNAARPLAEMLGDVIALSKAAIQGIAWNLVHVQALLATGLALLAVALGAGIWRFVRGRPDAWCLMAYLGVMALWPYPQEDWRLTWVLLPILLGNLFWLGEILGSRWPHVSSRLRPMLAWAPALAIAIAVVPGATLMGQRAALTVSLGEPLLRNQPDWYDPDPVHARHTAAFHIEIVRALRQFGTLIPDEACVFSASPLVTAYYIDRNTDFPPPDDDRFDRILRAKGCRYLVMQKTPTRLTSHPYWPRERIRDRLKILAEHGIPGDSPEEPEWLLGVLTD